MNVGHQRAGKRDLTMSKKAASPAPLHDVVLRPHWPEGLEQGKFYEFRCDDDGRDGDAFFRVLVANDGDVHLCASKLIEPGFTDKVSGERLPSIYDNFPSVRCRTGIGGGRHSRTRQALLWLAMAIKLDNEELGIKD
jgi:hypothetical protein